MRQGIVSKNKISQYLIYAIGEVVLVMFGIVLALQFNNWNEDRKNDKEEFFILEKLQSDLASDTLTINAKIPDLQAEIQNIIFCLEVLGRKKEVSKAEFMLKFGGILSLDYFNQNTTTFNNLVSSGKLELIDNKLLSDEIVNYYTQDYKGWDTALRDYTRNIIAPYLLSYDHIPQMNKTNDMKYYVNMDFYEADISSFDIKPKTLEDYRNNLFIINILRQKLFNYQGQLGWYKDLSNEMVSLLNTLEQEKIKLR